MARDPPRRRQPLLTRHLPSGENRPSSPESLNSSEKSMAGEGGGERPRRDSNPPAPPAAAARPWPRGGSGRKGRERGGRAANGSGSVVAGWPMGAGARWPGGQWERGRRCPAARRELESWGGAVPRGRGRPAAGSGREAAS